MKVIGFGAVWCIACRVMKPRIEEIEKENSWFKIKCYDYDKDKDMVTKYKIDKSLPIFIFLDKKGKEFLRLQGEISKEKFLRIIKENKNK